MTLLLSLLIASPGCCPAAHGGQRHAGQDGHDRPGAVATGRKRRRHLATRRAVTGLHPCPPGADADDRSTAPAPRDWPSNAADLASS